MPIASAQQVIKGLINGLAMPGTATPSLVAYITPPDPNVEADKPTAYIWPSDGEESRNPDLGGTVPRNTGPGTASGYKAIEHTLDVYLVWFGANDDPDADNLFPGMVDAVMLALRTSADPAEHADPYTGQVTTFIDIGEKMTYRVTLRSLVEQAYDRYDALITLSMLEIIQA